MIRQACTFHNYIFASFLISSVIFSFSLIFQISSKNTSLLKKSILPGGCSGKRGPGDGRDSHFHFNNILLILFLIFFKFQTGVHKISFRQELFCGTRHGYKSTCVHTGVKTIRCWTTQVNPCGCSSLPWQSLELVVQAKQLF